MFRDDVITAIAARSDDVERISRVDRVYGLATVPYIRSGADVHDVGVLAAWTFFVALFANTLLAPVLVLRTRPFGDRSADAAVEIVPQAAAQ